MENMKEAVKKLNAETKANWILDDGCASPTIKVIGAEEGDDYSITEAGLNWEVACTGYTQQFGNLEDAVNHIINTQND